MFSDTPRYTNTFRAKLLATVIFAAFLIAANLAGFSSDFIGKSIESRRSFGSEVMSGLLLVIGFATNLLAASKLSRRSQILLIWTELALLISIFFNNFHLDITFILSKVYFLTAVGVSTTLAISAVSILLASVFAFIGAIAKLSQSGIISGAATFYTSLFRGVPLLMQIYLIYLGLPQLGYIIDALPAGIAALSLCYGAYMTEIMRAGIQSIGRGQWEAGRTLGLGPVQLLIKVILPQVAPLVIPSISNQYISMLKDSSLVSVIGIWELMYLSRTLGSKTFQHIEMLITAALIYWAISILLEFVQHRLELKLAAK